LLQQFRSPLIYLLGAAALVSLVTDHLMDAGFIAVILVINATIGAYQEWRAEQSTRALQQLLRVRAAVSRADKTGTLTCNELTVRKVLLASGEGFEVTGEGFAPHGQVLLQGKPVEPGSHAELDRLVRAAGLCNEADLHLRDGAWAWRGDPTDVALLALAHKLGWGRETTLDHHPQVNEIPFEPERRYAATYHRMGEAVHVLVKGAPERVLTMCAWEQEARCRDASARASALAEQGYRVLALAEGSAPSNLDPSLTPTEPVGLTFLGIVGMIDPLRPGAREAVNACHEAGITR
jgi:magnesium-transporting ATPase (P-type)